MWVLLRKKDEKEKVWRNNQTNALKLKQTFFENNEENIKQIPVKLLSRKLFEIMK